MLKSRGSQSVRGSSASSRVSDVSSLFTKRPCGNSRFWSLLQHVGKAALLKTDQPHTFTRGRLSALILRISYRILPLKPLVRFFSRYLSSLACRLAGAGSAYTPWIQGAQGDFYLELVSCRSLPEESAAQEEDPPQRLKGRLEAVEGSDPWCSS